MEQFKPSVRDLGKRIKSEIETFIDESKTLTGAQKESLKKELGGIWDVDDRFKGEHFINDAVYYAVNEWKRVQLGIVDLWKQIAINNAKCNNEPHKVADEAVKNFEKKFTL